MRSSLILALLFPWITNANIQVHGHRGARSVLPENTLPALKYALELGVDVLEFDMVVTKDDAVVINHDLVVNNEICAYEKKNKPIIELTLVEFKKIDCGSKKNSRFPKQQPVPGTPMPTLDEVFTMVKNSSAPNAKKVFFNIETKINPKKPKLSPSPDKFARLVLDVIEKHRLEDRVILQSFDIRTLDAMRRLNPSIKRSFLVTKVSSKLISKVESLQVDMISPNHKRTSAKDVQQLQAKGFPVIPWTANTKRRWDQLIEKGVDGIITDDPAELINYLKAKGLR